MGGEVGGLTAVIASVARSEAIQTVTTGRLWIASSQGLLAMTGMERRLVSPQLALVRRVVRLIDRELIHRRRPQMLSEARRCEVHLTLRDAIGEYAVEIGDRSLHAEQRTQALHFLSVTPLLPRQLPRDEVEDVDGDAQFEGLVALKQRCDVAPEEI